MRDSGTARGRTGGIFFDLDGTLVDTAPDMVAVLTALQKDHGREPTPYELARSHVSNGAMGLVRLAFPDADEAMQQRLYEEYLDRYEASVCVGSTLFPGLTEVLARLDNEGLPWGVITNKPQRMTEPLLRQLELTERLCCTVSGDTLPQRKPHPAPLLHACRLANVLPGESVYVGDAERDVRAGRDAGMRTIAAAWGYIVAVDDPAHWQADVIAREPRELAALLFAPADA